MVRTAVLVMTFIAAAWSGAEASPPADVIPKPAEADRHRGEFILTPETRILVEAKDGSLAPIGDYLASRLRTATGFPWPEGNAATRSNVIRLGASRSAGPEGSYTLVCDERGVTIRAGSPAGVFYGVQTLLQLLPPEITGDTVAARVRWAVPHIAIDDAPRFMWRGMHLDVGRHFFPVAFVK